MIRSNTPDHDGTSFSAAYLFPLKTNSENAKRKIMYEITSM